MKIVELATGRKLVVDILPVEKADFKSLSQKRYFFNWALEKNYELYKLIVKGKHDILGLISLERITAEWRIHIRLLTVSSENKGSMKKFDRIAGNLIAHAAKLAVEEFGELACVSLKPKSVIAEHYMTKYNMNLTGMTLSLEIPEILNLINEYEN